MKTTIKVFVFAFSLLLAVGGLHAQQLTLDEAVKRAARGIEQALPQRTSVAILNFVSPAEAFSDYVIEELTGELVTGNKVTIVDRRSLALISQEMKLQLSGDVSDESAQAIGRMLGAQSIVSGTLTNLATFHRFRIRVIKVETAAIQTQISLDLQNNAQVAFLLGGSPAQAVAPAPAPASPAQTPAPTPAPTATATAPARAPIPAPTTATHKVGDKGPGGGLVFYSTEPRTNAVLPPVTGTFNVGATGPAGGLIFYSTEPRTSSVLPPATGNFTVGTAGPTGGLVFYSTEPRTSFVPPPATGSFTVGAAGPAGGVVFYPIATTTTTPKATGKVYQIGDTGPAGGIIFGVNPSAGPWKYLEAAPADISQKLYPCREAIEFKTTGRSVGSGKTNTEIIMREADSRGGGFGWAAQACDALVVNGFDDWFLPSRDELHYMYGSLRMQGLGNFTSERYWSSTYGEDYGPGFWVEDFSDGSQATLRYSGQCRVRAIRQF